MIRLGYDTFQSIFYYFRTIKVVNAEIFIIKLLRVSVKLPSKLESNLTANNQAIA